MQFFLLTYISCVNIQRCGLRGSHHIHVAVDTDTLFTLYEPAQILRQVERATKVFSQYPPPSQGWWSEGWNRVGRCENAKGSIRNTVVCSPRKKKAEGRQRCRRWCGNEHEPKEYEPYVRRARYKLWAATCMRVITYRDLTVSSQVKHRLVRRVAR